MGTRTTRLLNGEQVDREMPMEELIAGVEDAFRAYELGDAQMPAKSYIDLRKYNGDFRSMPAYLETENWDAAAIKWVNVHPDNPEQFDLPTVMGTVIYSDPETAYPLALIDGTVLTKKRTGAAAGVATDHLAIPDATSMGIIGAGIQAYTQLEAVAAVRDIETVVVSDVDESKVADFIDHFEGRFEVRAGSIAEAASCDVLSTVTPVREPIVSREDLGEHTHVNAMGADAEGKQELEPAVLQSATVVIDDYEQCTHSGEINVPFHDGAFEDGDIYGEIGEIVAGNRPGREGIEGVTVFDSTGLAIQDVAAAHVVYEHAIEEDIGTDFDLLGV
jgi:alanine dehydrogenase